MWKLMINIRFTIFFICSGGFRFDEIVQVVVHFVVWVIVAQQHALFIAALVALDFQKSRVPPGSFFKTSPQGEGNVAIAAPECLREKVQVDEAKGV